jgi:hypothetical protein
MQFDASDNVIFSDVNENISQMSLRSMEGNKYALMYYYNSKRKLRENIKDCILEDYSNRDVGTMEVEAFGMVTFEERIVESKIMEMKGSWYDLNGQMLTLGLLLREIMKADATGQLKDYKVKLSSFVDGHIVSAKMGDVAFKRLV